MTRVNDQYFKERQGVTLFAQRINELRGIWRETPNADVGIDGQVESVDDVGETHGHIVAVQVKSGTSYVEKGNNEHEIHYYPGERHLRYWKNFPLPVMLVVVAADNRTIFWTDARQQLRSPFNRHPSCIRIPLSQVLNEESRQQFFASVGPFGGRILTIDEVVTDLARQRSDRPEFDISFLDLFALGMIDIGSKLFFSMQLCMEIVEYRAEEHGVAYGIGPYEHAFLDQYIDFLVSQNLIHFDYAQYLIDRDHRGLHPVFIAPFTERGQHVNAVLRRYEQDSRVFYESFIGMIDPFQERLPVRMNELTRIQRLILENTPRDV